MRAHFASDVPVSPDSDNEIKSPLSHYQNGTIGEDGWQSRIGKFKMNSIQMAVVCEFIDDILQRAKEEALRQRSAQYNKNIRQGKIKSQKQSFTDGGKVGNMARVFVVRVFDAICNCANNAASGPMSRLKFHGGKRTSTTGSTSFGSVANEKTDNNGNKTTKASKKNVSVKENKMDSIISKVDGDVSAQGVTELS